MSKKGWHFAALQKPATVHIAVTARAVLLSVTNFLSNFLCTAVPQTLTIPMVGTLIADLKDAVEGGTMVAVYGLVQSSPVGPDLVGELAASFVDVLYKA